jgi:hypothetical protein
VNTGEATGRGRLFERRRGRRRGEREGVFTGAATMTQPSTLMMNDDECLLFVLAETKNRSQAR